MPNLRQWPIRKRTDAVIAEIVEPRGGIKAQGNRQLEIIMNFKDAWVRLSPREIREPREIE